MNNLISIFTDYQSYKRSSASSTHDSKVAEETNLPETYYPISMLQKLPKIFLHFCLEQFSVHN